MSLLSVLARARRASRSRMLDTCDIEYEDGTTFDEDLGRTVPNMVKRLTGVPCRVKQAARAVQEDEVGGRTAVTVVREVELPWDTAGVQVGDVAVVTAIHSSSVPSLLGARLRLDGPSAGSQDSALRLQVSEVIA